MYTYTITSIIIGVLIVVFTMWANSKKPRRASSRLMGGANSRIRDNKGRYSKGLIERASVRRAVPVYYMGEQVKTIVL